jgi:hypothetical protein
LIHRRVAKSICLHFSKTSFSVAGAWRRGKFFTSIRTQFWIKPRLIDPAMNQPCSELTLRQIDPQWIDPQMHCYNLVNNSVCSLSFLSKISNHVKDWRRWVFWVIDLRWNARYIIVFNDFHWENITEIVKITKTRWKIIIFR